MAVRCKMKLWTITRQRMTTYDYETQQNVEREANTLAFNVVTTGSEEDKAFWAATPAGRLELAIVNPEAVKALDLNKTYYITITPADDPA